MRGRRSRSQSRLSQIVETLEGRQMLSAASIDVHQVLWNGELVEAVRDEYVLRMPQLNAARATSVADFQSRTPRTPDGWQVSPLGMGFYKLSAPGASEQIVTAWAQRQLVRYVEPNVVRRAAATPNDPLYTAPENWAFGQIDAETAWDTSTGVSGNVVAVLDTGIDFNHPDLRDNMWRDPNTGAYGFSAFGGTPMDNNGHGTFAAGLIGAVGDNAEGIAGVNWSVSMMAVKVLGANGTGTAAQVIAGVNYVINQKIDGQAISTAHCGFARPDFSQGEFEALQTLGALGVVIVCAAGNELNDNDLNPRYPANYDIPSLISVAASTTTDTLAGFSNFGATTVDLAAPGVDLLSTRWANANPFLFPPYQANNAYTVGSGTSFSSALVAGAAALLKAVKPTASASQIRTAILDGVDQVPALNGLVATGGRLNLAESVDLILSTIGTVPVASFKQGQVTRVVEGDAGHSFLDVTVVLDRPPAPGKTAVVAWETRPGGSAFQGVDFVAQSGLLTFSGSQAERSFRLRIIGDRIAEPNEQFAVRLIQGRSRDVEVENAQINITIVDDDYNTQPVVPEPSLVLQPRVTIVPLADADGIRIPVLEGQPAQFVVQLDRTSNKTVTVRYRTHEPAIKPLDFATAGKDYLSTTGTVTFRPGESSKIISVKTLKDTVLETEPELFNVLLYDPVNAVLSGADSVGRGEILDVLPDPPAPPPGAGGFTITLNFLNDVPQAVRDASTAAALRWEQIIVGDLPDVVDPTTGEVIDDIRIDVQMGLLGGQSSDGPGGALANAGPRAYRNGGQGLPYLGAVGVDPADIDRPILTEVMIHEFAHALGFPATVAFQSFISGNYFTGPNAVREYRTIFGAAADPAGVPVEAGGGAGTSGAHWDEDVFGNELMTGFISAGGNPLSRVSVGAFADIGYTVNYDAADPYSPPTARVPRGQALAPLVVLTPLPLSASPPLATQLPGTTPAAPHPGQQTTPRPQGNQPVNQPVAQPVPGTRLPVTRTVTVRTPVVVQPVATTPVARQPVTRQPVTAS
jgi:subtilisin family serine protease